MVLTCLLNGVKLTRSWIAITAWISFLKGMFNYLLSNVKPLEGHVQLFVKLCDYLLLVMLLGVKHGSITVSTWISLWKSELNCSLSNVKLNRAFVVGLLSGAPMGILHGRKGVNIWMNCPTVRISFGVNERWCR